MVKPTYLTTPQQFLTDLPNLPEGWSEQEGGLIEVVRQLGAFQEILGHQTEAIAAIRAAAINELLKTYSGAQIGRELGLTRVSISRIAKAKTWSDPKW